jgi:ATP-dependent helicase HrpA
MARLPLDPRLSCMLLEAHQRECLDDLAVICSALSIQDPRERPAARQAEADRAQARFAVPTSDFITLVRIWHTYRQVVRRRKSWADVKTFCRDHFLSFRRMREWQDIYRQIISYLGEHDIAIDKRSVLPSKRTAPLRAAGTPQCTNRFYVAFSPILPFERKKQIYQASHNRQVMLFPGSGLFKTPPQWVVAAEMVETSRLFARCAAALDPAWLEPIGGSLCTYSYSDPHWERNRGQVVATEQVSLFGLIIEKRSRPYGPSDPDGATAIFIRAALIEGDVRQPLSFMQHNQRVLARAESMEDRLRRRDIRLDDAALVDFYRGGWAGYMTCAP